ncbi:MAG: YceD family protein [Methyloligellaceae bacterium]
MTPDTTAVFSKPYRVDRIPDQGTSGQIQADDSERRAMAKIMELESLDRLTLRFEMNPIGKGRYRVQGHLEAVVTQNCVITLEPIRSEIAEDIDLEFWPEIDLVEASEADLDKAFDPEHDDPEPIRDGVIDLGVVAYETLATGLDPYPRKPDAAFEWSDDETVQREASEAHPFDVLRTLKPD